MQTTISDGMKMVESIPKRGESTVGKGAISPFPPQCFQKTYFRHVKKKTGLVWERVNTAI